MKIIHLPLLTTPDGTGEIACSLNRKASLIILFVGCDYAVPGAIVSLETHPAHDWLVCWVTPPPDRYPWLRWRAGIMPVPDGHTGAWPQEKGWAL